MSLTATPSEHHKWEPEEDVQTTCRRLVEIIIRDEDGHDNYKELDIPEHVVSAIEKVNLEEASNASLPALESAQ